MKLNWGRTRGVRLLAGLAVLAVIVVGCGPDDADDSTAGGTNTVNEEQVDIRGTIQNVEQGTGNRLVTIMVEGSLEPDTSFDKASISVRESTRIYRSVDGLRTHAEISELTEGASVEVNFDGPIMESYPVQSSAGTIVILAESFEQASLKSVPFNEPDSIEPSGSSLDGIQEKIAAHIEELEVEHGIAVQGYGTGADQFMLMIRSYGDFERKLSEEELEAIKQSLYKYAGKTFEVDLQYTMCCEGPGLTGVITQIDEEQQRVLIVNEKEKNGNTDDPVATWVGMTEDGKIFRAGESEAISFEQLAVGQEVQAWSTGMMMASYPGQTSAIKIVVK